MLRLNVFVEKYNLCLSYRGHNAQVHTQIIARRSTKSLPVFNGFYLLFLHTGTGYRVGFSRE